MNGLGMKCIRHVHLRLNFICRLCQIVAVLVGANLGKAQVGFRIEQSGIDGHSLGVKYFCARGHFGRLCGAYGNGNLSSRHDHGAVFNRAVGDGQNFTADNGDRLRGCARSIVGTGLDRLCGSSQQPAVKRMRKMQLGVLASLSASFVIIAFESGFVHHPVEVRGAKAGQRIVEEHVAIDEYFFDARVCG